jgi:glycosyltransferase involved in cell wall biosynthesis
MSPKHKPGPPKKLALIGNYLPRQCGIAAFTADLSDALVKALGPQVDVLALAINDLPEGYRYPERVCFELRENVQNDYLMAADFLNINQVEVVVLQHEYGIFGGPYGAYILPLLGELRMPVLTTLHTVLAEPSKEQHAVMKELVRLSERLIVLNPRAKKMMAEIYDAPPKKLVHIPHGIPDFQFVDPNRYKGLIGIEGRKVILTFGLLGPGKGIETTLKAMPQIVQRHPEALYIILGATHPHVRRASGEEYRYKLQHLIRQLGLREHVIFYNRFVTQEELFRYIGATDIYVISYPSPDQVVSGSLAYALGAGKAIVSTPFRYAEEVLADGRGCLVPFRDSDATADSICHLLEHEEKRHAMAKRAYQFSRRMVWKEVAKSYLKLAGKVISERAEHPRPLFLFTDQVQISDELPSPNLQHLRNMTDDTGMLQHAIFATPNRDHGYCVDDNARALIATLLYWNLRKDDSVIPLMHTYLAFMAAAFNPKLKRFRNFMSYERRWLEAVGSEDSHARVIWALGFAVASAPNDSIRSVSVRLFSEALPVVHKFISPRALSFILIGFHAYLERFGGDAEVRRLRATIASRLYKQFNQNATPEWPWCEDNVTYANARLPHALLLSGQWIPEPQMVECGLRTLEWLLRIQTGDDGQLSIIGNKGWLARDAKAAACFDQQPIEVMGLIDACAEAYRMTRDQRWIIEARHCLEWFLGKNDLHVPLCDFKTGGCFDGLTPHGPNGHQGAESTLAWLISLLTVHHLQATELYNTLTGGD